MIKLQLGIFFMFFLGYVYAQQPIEITKALNHFKSYDFIGCIEVLDDYIQKTPDAVGDAFLYRGFSRYYLNDMDGACPDLMLALEKGDKKNEVFIRYNCDKQYKLKHLKEHFYKNDSLFPEFNYRPRYTRRDTLRGSLRHERTSYDVSFYDLQIQLIPKKKSIKGQNTIYFTVLDSTKVIQVDLFKHYHVKSVNWNNIELSYIWDADAMFIEFPDTLLPHTQHRLLIVYEGKPPIAENPPWQGGFVWKRDKRHNHWAGVACEHFGASSWWPCKDHPSDEPDSMRMTFVAPKRFDVISNGKRLNIQKFDNRNNASTWFVHYPINNYNVTFYLGKFKHFSDTLINSEDTVQMNYYVLPYNLSKAKEVFKQNKPVLKCYEKYYGPYPFPKDGYALIESPYAGMEHQSAIAYGNGYGKNKRLINKEWDYIIVHEAAHEWWGNAITGADMADMWIQEGFATYSEPLFLECVEGHEAYLKEIAQKMSYTTNFWPMVENYGVNEYSFASSDVYYKGAVMLHNLRCVLNDNDQFFKLLKAFFTQYKYQIVGTQDFIDFANKTTGKNLTPFFKKFLYDAQLPVLAYKYRRVGDDITFSYKWQDVEDGFEMPVGLRAGMRSYRLDATTEWKEVRLRNANSFFFFNFMTGFDGCPANSFTYFSAKNIK